MKRIILLTSWLGLSLSLYSFPMQAQTCPHSNSPQSTAYMLRQDYKRCEGIRAFDASVDLSLISFSLGRIQPAKELALEIPILANQLQPKVRVQHPQKYYQLDPLELRRVQNRFQFQWNNDVLTAENIPAEGLRATAYFLSGSQRIYVPVILGRGVDKYNIILSSGRRVKIPLFQILHREQVVYSSSRATFQPRGQIAFTWNGRTPDSRIAPRGRYVLRVNAEQEQDNALTRPASLNITFEHDPQWLN